MSKKTGTPNQKVTMGYRERKRQSRQRRTERIRKLLEEE